MTDITLVSKGAEAILQTSVNLRIENHRSHTDETETAVLCYPDFGLKLKPSQMYKGGEGSYLSGDVDTTRCLQ